MFIIKTWADLVTVVKHIQTFNLKYADHFHFVYLLTLTSNIEYNDAQTFCHKQKNNDYKNVSYLFQHALIFLPYKILCCIIYKLGSFLIHQEFVYHFLLGELISGYYDYEVSPLGQSTSRYKHLSQFPVKECHELALLYVGNDTSVASRAMLIKYLNTFSLIMGSFSSRAVATIP